MFDEQKQGERSVIRRIAKKELLLNVMTFKFAVGTTLCVLLVAVFMPMLLDDYRQRLEEYHEAVTNNVKELRKAKVYMNLTPTVFRPPAILSVFCEGMEKRLDNSAKIEFESIPTIRSTSSEVNSYLSIFPILDVMLIFKIVMSLLALLVTYDTICGERERRTLKLILSNKTARYQVLLAKLLAGLVTLVIPITMIFIVGLLILEVSPMVDLVRSDWARIGLMYLVSLIFISVMHNIGLLFSCLAKRSAVSLILALLCWVIYTVVIPNGSVCAAMRIKLLEPRETIDNQLANLRQERKREEKELVAKIGPWSGTRQGDLGAFGRDYTRAVDKPFARYEQKRCAVVTEHSIKYAQKFRGIEQSYLDSLLEQKHLANTMSRTSPISLYENVMCALAGTDTANSQHFVSRTRAYRNEVIEYIRSHTKDFTLPCFFTPFSEENMIEYGELRAKSSALSKLPKDQRGELDAVYKRSMQLRKMEKPPLDLRDFPHFYYSLRSIAGTLQTVIPDLMLLILDSVLFFILSFVAFQKYDVR